MYYRYDSLDVALRAEPRRRRFGRFMKMKNLWKHYYPTSAPLLLTLLVTRCCCCSFRLDVVVRGVPPQLPHPKEARSRKQDGDNRSHGGTLNGLLSEYALHVARLALPAGRLRSSTSVSNYYHKRKQQLPVAHHHHGGGGAAKAPSFFLQQEGDEGRANNTQAAAAGRAPASSNDEDAFGDRRLV